MFIMAHPVPTVLILGHSFVRRLRCDLNAGFDSRAVRDFHLKGSANVHLFGIGGRTIAKLKRHDLHVISELSPDIVILEIGTNDLSSLRPEVVGSAIDDLVRLLIETFHVPVIGVCHVIQRGAFYPNPSVFNANASILNEYVKTVLDLLPNVFTWSHGGFSNPSVQLLLPDGVHVNPVGQYKLYRSYRGAIIKALSML